MLRTIDGVMRFKSPERLTWAHLLVSIIVMGGSYSPGSTAHAAVALPSDVTAFGSYFFDVSTSGVLGDAEHSGSLYATVGGVTRQVELTYQADSNGGTLGPNNPVSSNLTHHGGGTIGAGDGFGGDAFVDAMASSLTSFTADTDLDFSSGPSFVSTPLLLSNQSLDQAYRVFSSFTYNHFVEATGPDAGIRSDFDVGLDDTRLFNTELASDTVVGNAIDEEEFPDDLGGPLAASGVFQFDFVLSPGETQGV
ncbi:MAG: hypothetical protein AAF745_18150, partial [Planctomycetota bacterium]